jgi:cytochrome oxidase Cu insertion factor (SCO1/SenC/PrrC family)
MNRREILAAVAAGTAAAALPETGLDAAPQAAPSPAARAAADASCGAAAGWFPNVVVTSHENRRALFYNDLIRGKTVMINFMSIAGEADNPVTANLAEVQRLLGERMRREVFLYSITLDPERDTPRALAAFAARHGAGPGWLFLTGEAADLRLLRERLFAHDGSRDVAGAADCSHGLVRYGNGAVGLWGSAPARSDPGWLAARLSWVRSGTAAAAAGPPRRRGPAPLIASLLLLAAGLALAAPGSAGPASTTPDCTDPATAAPAAPAPAAPAPVVSPACGPPAGSPYLHPHPQPLPCASRATPVGDTTFVVTGESIFPPSKPFQDPPGTNFLPTVYTNLFDSRGCEIPNTLPSTPAIPYNLLDGEPVVSPIDPISPRDDLSRIFDAMARYAKEPRGFEEPVTKPLVLRAIRMGIDILEGNPVENRAYSGSPLLHYDGPDKLKKVKPIHDDSGKLIGGELQVHQLWYDNHIESDTSLLDVSAVMGVPWTIVFTVDVLSRGEDDFAPFLFYQDPTKEKTPVPLAGMDATFFPMRDGTRTVFRVKMAPGKYFSRVYTWGWRMHPPRVQVIEDANLEIDNKTLLQYEVAVFGESPRSSQAAKLYAIGKIGDLAPAKRMWKALRDALTAAERDDYRLLAALAGEGRAAFEDWTDRTRLPRGVMLDKTTDMTLFFVNNTIYGEFADGDLRTFPQWQTRGAKYRATLYNGDYFDHGYMIADFGGARGWENQFKSSVKDGGSGCWFTFGRLYWWPVLPQMISVPAAALPVSGSVPDHLVARKVDVTFNWDPSRRLRFYQFDPIHHDVAIFSVH